jgi:glycine oxidase
LPISSEVIIIGGGAVGAACARELARRGRRVLVLERGTDEGAAWRAAAGMLAPQIEASADDPFFAIALAGRECYPALGRELFESTGINIRFWREGIVRVATNEDEVPILQARAAWQRQRELSAQWLEPELVREKWPWLGEHWGALWAPDEAALDPALLVHALLADAKLAGAQVREERIFELNQVGDRVTGVTGTERYTADHVILAAGAWSPTIAGAPSSLPIVPVRGQMVSFSWPSEVPRSIVFGEQVYVVPRGDEAIVGSTMEYAGFDPRVTREGLDRLIGEARLLCPFLQDASPRRSWAGLRPVTPDGLPIIGPEPALRGLWYATGHGRNGILLAAVTGRIIAQLMDGVVAVAEVAMVRPDRFPSGSESRKALS